MPTTTTTSLPELTAELPRAARRVLTLLRHLRHGSLDIQTPDGEQLHFGQERQPRAAIRITDWAVCEAALKSGDVGFAESFMAGHWTSPDLSALLELLIRNRTALEELFYGGFWGGLLYRVRHAFNRNTRSGSRKNIQAHYDLGNEFYRLWLDPTMNYSSAWFEGAQSGDLVQAQQAKMRRALAEAQVAPGSRVLEIGCGWGAVAQDRLGKAGLSADLRLQDYRDIADEPFDAVVSIEMFEAVGREYWDGYFRTVADKLKPGGRACIQSITIRDDLFERYVRSTDFIQQYIFPGGLLPSPSQFRLHAERAGLKVVNELAFGADYAETLRRWRETFLRHDGRVRELGFDTRFMRLWEFYLAYCEAAFAAGNTDVMQFTLVKA
jgi:cyclopropane-fatty-acyl-phospholipid synthase